MIEIKHRATRAVLMTVDAPNLRGANLNWADLNWADLRDIDLRGANLRGADLRGADLNWADLRDTDLRGVNLGGADLRGAIGNMREVVSLQMDAWSITMTKDVIAIGCQQHSVEFWENADDATISAMDKRALEWWKIWKPCVLGIHDAKWLKEK